MSRILITGDTHGSLSMKKILDIDYLGKGDFVIITGDAGIVWNFSTDELLLIDKLKKKPFTLLFIDGNHENFDALNSMKVEIWNGGKVHKIAKNIIHLMRGQIFNISGRKIFTFGGATSVDKFKRIEGIDWWENELPTFAETEEGLNNLNKNRNKVDFIITHTAPLETLEFLSKTVGFKLQNDCITDYLKEIKDITSYKHWFFGHFHIDQYLFENQTAIFNKFIDI